MVLMVLREFHFLLMEVLLQTGHVCRLWSFIAYFANRRRRSPVGGGVEGKLGELAVREVLLQLGVREVARQLVCGEVAPQGGDALIL